MRKFRDFLALLFVLHISFRESRSTLRGGFHHVFRILQEDDAVSMNCDTMPFDDEQISSREDLTDFGELFHLLRTYIGTSTAAIVQRSGLDKTTISRVTRQRQDTQTNRPKLETVEALYKALEAIGQEKHIPLSQDMKNAFYNAIPACYATPEQSKRASALRDRLKKNLGKRARD